MRSIKPSRHQLRAVQNRGQRAEMAVMILETAAANVVTELEAGTRCFVKGEQTPVALSAFLLALEDIGNELRDALREVAELKQE